MSDQTKPRRKINTTQEEKLPEVPMDQSSILSESEGGLDAAIANGNPEEEIEADAFAQAIEAAKAKKLEEQQNPQETKKEESDEIPVIDQNVSTPPPTRAKNDVSEYLYAINGSRQDLDDAYEASVAQDTRSEEDKQSSPDPYQLSLATYLRYGTGSSQATLLGRFTKSIEEEATKAGRPNPIQPCGRSLRLAKIIPPVGNPNATGPQVLKGEAARTAVIARLKGVFRIPLYNSGFHIHIRPMNLAELNMFTNEVDNEFREIGRILGGYSHLVTDVFLKRKICEILPSLIVSSNFNFDGNSNTLMNNISFHDYDVILWALCTTVYPEGVDMTLTCVNPECRFEDNKQKVSLKDMCFHNLEAFPAAAIKWMEEGFSKTRSEADLKNYRENILPFKRSLTTTLNKDNFELQVPTIGTICQYGSDLVSKLVSLSNEEKDLTTDTLRSVFTLQLYRMYAPWIAAINICNDDGSVKYRIEDIEAIAEALEASSFEGTDFNVDLMKFVRDSKATFIGYTSLECPVCHKKPNFTEDNFVPVDVQHFFYCLSSRQLEQIGMQS